MLYFIHETISGCVGILFNLLQKHVSNRSCNFPIIHKLTKPLWIPCDDEKSKNLSSLASWRDFYLQVAV